MLIEFDQDYLRELYEDGKASDKKHRFHPQVVRGYQKAVKALFRARRLEDLYCIKSLNYEALTGNKKGRFSVRANGKYRIEFSVRQVDGEVVATLCLLLELSNHYD